MPAYKDKKTSRWYVQVSYKDWNGKTKHTCKRGFETKRNALAWEQEYLSKVRESTDMLFKDFVDVYLGNREVRIRESTLYMKKDIIRTHLIPFFGDMKLSDISTKDVMKWQTIMMKKVNQQTGKTYSKSYLKTVHNQLNAILNHAVRYYDLQKNAASIVGNMGTETEIKMKFWTLEQYKQFEKVSRKDPMFHLCFEILYWCGLRRGEMLALTPADIDLESKMISVNKTYMRKRKQDIFSEPKTKKSIRKVQMPDFLSKEVEDYLQRQYDMSPDGRMFPINQALLKKRHVAYTQEAGLPFIRIHDFRHSHVSLLINLGYSAVAIADRVGHESVEITYRYAHLFPDVQTLMANKLNQIKGKEENEQ